METGFLDRVVLGLPCVVYVPRDYDASRAWPVILALHGAGERGSDGIRATQIGIASAIRAEPERFPAIAVFPQAPAGERWLGGPAAAAILALEQAIVEWNGDRERLYVTGLSMGGYGALHLALAHPATFAALVVVCGGLVPHATTEAVARSPLIPPDVEPYAFVASALRSTPLWLFHGADDPVIPVEESRKLHGALAAGGVTRYTEYEGSGHNCWDRAYREEGLAPWLFAQRRVSR